MTQTIIDRCEAKGLRITGQRRVIAQVLEDSSDHPDVEELYARASAVDSGISLATVYRTVKLFEESGILERLEFGDGRARYEDATREHHDHLIDVQTGDVIEFVDPEIEALAARIVAAGDKQRMPVREYFPGEKPYRMVYVEDPFGIVFELYSHSYELTYSAGAYGA